MSNYLSVIKVFKLRYSCHIVTTDSQHNLMPALFSFCHHGSYFVNYISKISRIEGRYIGIISLRGRTCACLLRGNSVEKAVVIRSLSNTESWSAGTACSIILPNTDNKGGFVRSCLGGNAAHRHHCRNLLCGAANFSPRVILHCIFRNSTSCYCFKSCRCRFNRVYKAVCSNVCIIIIS